MVGAPLFRFSDWRFATTVATDASRDENRRILTPEDLKADGWKLKAAIRQPRVVQEASMQSCQVCGNPVTESIERETGRTMSGAKEIDPTAGTKRFWGGKWYHFDTLVCRSKFESAPNSYLET